LALITQIIKEGNNVLLKDAVGKIVSNFPSNGTHAFRFEHDDYTIVIRGKHDDTTPVRPNSSIDSRAITEPAGPWTRETLLQELSDNYLNQKLDVNAVVSPPEGVKRNIDIVESLVNGSTTDDVQSMSIWFDGKNGTLKGVIVPDGYVATFSPNGDQDTIGSIPYTVPDTKGLRVVITYVYKT